MKWVISSRSRYMSSAWLPPMALAAHTVLGLHSWLQRTVSRPATQSQHQLQQGSLAALCLLKQGNKPPNFLSQSGSISSRVRGSAVVSLYRRKKIIHPGGWRVGPRDRKKEMSQLRHVCGLSLRIQDTLKREGLPHLGQVWHALGDFWKADRDEMLGCSVIERVSYTYGWNQAPPYLVYVPNGAPRIDGWVGDGVWKIRARFNCLIQLTQNPLLFFSLKIKIEISYI